MNEFDNLESTLARMEARLFEVKRDVSELKGQHAKFDRFQTTLDGMARQMDSFERWCLEQLESKPQ